MYPGGLPAPPTSAAIQLRLLGTLSVRVDAGPEVGAVLAQPKRFALLAYLAASTPRRFHRRDALLALFWPDADQEHARTSLRKAVHFLRQQVGSEVIVGRGDEEIGLADELCWCDVAAFEDAVRSGRFDKAAELYRGDLLPGLHLSDMPEFERWLEEARARLKDQAVRAAWMLAEQEKARAQANDALKWARRATELSPYDERGIRRLLTMLVEAGDRAGAVLCYQQFAQRLSAELELEPSADTIALAESVRNHHGAASRVGSAALAAPVPPASLLDAPRASGEVAPTMRREQPLWRRHRWVLASLVGLGAAAIGAALWLPRSPPTPASADAIAILPFEYRGSPELSYLADGVADLLSTRLDGAPGVRTVDPRALFSFVSRERGGNDLDRGRRAAEHFGASGFVLGSIVEAGDRLQISATIYDREGRSLGSVEAPAAGESRIFDVADQLARHILSAVQEEPLDLARVADQTTSSLPALKAYIEGERELRNGRPPKAIEAFQRATAFDSSFALAHYRLGLLSRDGTVARAHLDRALRHSGRVGEHQRGLIKALDATLRGNHKEAERQYRSVLTAHPDDVEAWSMLALLVSSRGSLAGYAWVDAREANERVLALDPQNAFALWHLATFAARDRRLTDLDSLTNRFLQLQPIPYYAGDIRGQRAVVLGDTAGVERFVAELRARPDEPAQIGAGVVTMTTGDLTTGRRLWRLITEPNRSRGMRVLAHVTLAKIELTNGRWGAARAELESAGRLDPGTALEHRTFYALTRFLNVPPAELIALRDSLDQWDALPGHAGEGLPAMHRSVRPYLKLYLLGMLSARVGEDSAALRYASALERADSSTIEGAFAIDQAQLVRVEVAWMRGRAREALGKLEQADFWTTHSALDDTGDSPFYTRMHERFTRAELLHELGRSEEALPWYRAFTYELLYNAPAHYRLGQIYRARGDKAKAIEHYRRAVELWRDCDPMLQAAREQATAELAGLG
jgi:serine/threonine-protein kinase